MMPWTDHESLVFGTTSTIVDPHPSSRLRRTRSTVQSREDFIGCSEVIDAILESESQST